MLVHNTFRRGDLVLTWRERGGRGPPVVLQHGLCADARQTFATFPATSEARLITLNCRGHDGSAVGDPARLSIATFADDVAALIENQVGAPVILGGTSMGAAIALRLVVTRPALARALVLIRPAWTAEAAPANMRLYAAVGRRLQAQPAAAAAEAFAASPIGRRLAEGQPEAFATLMGFFSRRPQEVSAELLCRIAADGPGVSRAAIARVAMPTLIVGAMGDPLHPLLHAEALAGLIPGSRLIRVPSKARDRRGHSGAIGDALVAFLASIQEEAVDPLDQTGGTPLTDLRARHSAARPRDRAPG